MLDCSVRSVSERLTYNALTLGGIPTHSNMYRSNGSTSSILVYECGDCVTLWLDSHCITLCLAKSLCVRSGSERLTYNAFRELNKMDLY